MKAKDIVTYTNELMDASLNGTSNYIRKNLAHQENILLQDQSHLQPVKKSKIPDLFGLPFKRDVLKC